MRRLQNYWDTIAEQKYSRRGIMTEEQRAEIDAFRARKRENRTAELDAKCSVYFMRSADTGRIKIGYSQNVLRRRNELQGAHGGRIQILLTVPGGPTLEAEMHERFKAHMTFGEWFEPADEILAFIECEKAKHRPRAVS
jgi:hypothetical protein